MGGGILSEAIILAVICPLSSLRAAAFVPAQSTFASSWTQQQQLQQQPRQQRSLAPECSEHCSGGRRSRNRLRVRRQSCGGVVRMQTDTDTEMEASSSAIVVPPAVSSPLIQFDGSEASGEVDSFLGELNFCLGPGDSVLSGPSLTKDLNTAANKMVKNLLILNSPEDEEHAVRDTDAIEAGFASVHVESPGFAEAQAYLSCVCQLAKEGCPSQEALNGLSEPYKLAFRRVAGVLSDFGCSLTPGQSGRVRPTDENICLSILDYITPDQEGGGEAVATEQEKAGAGEGAGAAKAKPITPTRALNMLANRVVRTVCVGSDEDLQGLAKEMESKRTKFLSKVLEEGWEGSQEDMFFGSLVTLVRNGLTDEDPALKGAYLNSYQRLVGIVVQEVGTRSTPASEMILSSFLAWEREIRKELTEPAWESRPPDLIGSWALEAAGWDGLSDLPVDGAEMEDLGLNDLVVSFRKDGTVQVPVEKGVGLEWRVEPGPTHLDTVYFEMIPAAPKVSASSEAGSGGGTTLSYTGYVDRGARIEARFSKRFVKMTGRMTSVVRGQKRPSTRFSMRLVERGEAKGLVA